MEEEDEGSQPIANTGGGVNEGGCLQFLPGLPDEVALHCLAQASIRDYASLSCVNKRFRRLIASEYLYELRKQLGVEENWVYLADDANRWVAYDPVSNKWMDLPKIPCDECFDHANKKVLAVGSELLVFGCEIETTRYRFSTWKYSWVRRGWVKCEGMNQARFSFGSGSFGSMAVVAGGTDGNRSVLNSAEMYDSSTGKWEMLPNMNSPRRSCSGFFMDGKFYVIGGMSPTGRMLTCGEEYDFKSRKWRTIVGMYPDNEHGSVGASLPVAVTGNELYAVERQSSTVKKYDKATNTWEKLGRVPVKFRLGFSFKACGGDLVLAGPEGGAAVIHSSGVENGTLDWKVVGAKELVGCINGLMRLLSG